MSAYSAGHKYTVIKTGSTNDNIASRKTEVFLASAMNVFVMHHTLYAGCLAVGRGWQGFGLVRRWRQAAAVAPEV